MGTGLQEASGKFPGWAGALNQGIRIARLHCRRKATRKRIVYCQNSRPPPTVAGGPHRRALSIGLELCFLSADARKLSLACPAFDFVRRRLGADPSATDKGRVHALKITMLSTMLADGAELGEWGFSALVEADGHRILLTLADTAMWSSKIAATLKIDLTTVPEGRSQSLAP